LKKTAAFFNISLSMPKSKEAVVLFSGGIDSTTALYWARTKYARVTALSFDYGQRHRIEISLGRRLTRRLRVPHLILKLDLGQVGGSALTDRAISLPRFRRVEEIGKGIPPTYVPFRNGIFLSLAAAWAEANDIHTIVCGFNTIDSPHYPDTRASFIRAMEKAINSGTKASAGSRRMRIMAPFIRMKKSAIIKKGLSLGADYSYSISCYRGREIPCGKCSSCLLREKAWAEAGFRDHLLLRLEKKGKR
jgi:7-cyano-7-deazaguanine synthase